VADVLRHPAVRETVARGLARMQAEGGGSSTFATRALLMAEPPSVDVGEITDKGYVNQLAVLANRGHEIERLNDDAATGWIGAAVPAAPSPATATL
ncbi:MAG: hypothetical protein WBA66_09720, partial [Xanthobacteraceae bacterium]